MAARRRRVKLDENWREKIRMGVLLDRLEKHALGAVDMSATQIKAAEVLLRKCLPDMSAINHSGDMSLTVNVRD